MGLFEGLLERVGNVFNSGLDEILFFVLVFLLLFKGGAGFGRDGEPADNDSRSADDDSGSSLFFTVLFLMLFLGGGDREEVA